MSLPDKFDKTYFECGVESGISLYENYRWQPERSIPMAKQLKTMFSNGSILDFGCAKGFLVKALRMIGVESWGVDISHYALKSAPRDVRMFLFGKLDDAPPANVVFAKDTLEHIPYIDIDMALRQLSLKAQQAMFIVPLGYCGAYRIPDYNLDITHIIAESEGWWHKKFEDNGYYDIRMHYQIPGFKDNWAQHKYGNAFFLMRS